MAINRQAQAQESGGDRSALAAARSRRLFFGANVAVMVVIAAVLVVAVNWIANAQHKRIDVASAGVYGLSERTKKIVEECPAKEITFTAVYTSTERDKARDRYLPRVRDLFDELESASSKVKVRYLSDDDQKRELIERVQGKYAGKSGDYKALIEFAKNTWTDMDKFIKSTIEQYNRLMMDKKWIGGFSAFAKFTGELTQDGEELEQTRREVDELVGGIGLPKYEEAKRKIETVSYTHLTLPTIYSV